MKGAILAALAALTMVAQAQAQDKPQASKYAIGDVVTNSGATLVNGEYYTQLVATMTIPDFPEAKRQDVIETIFNAIGGSSNDVRKINVTLKVKYGNTDLPEYSLASYTMDRKAKTISGDVGATRYFPLSRLTAGDAISIELIYKDIKQKDFDINKIVTTISGFIPGSTVVNAVSQPFVQKVSDATSAILTSASSGTENSAYRDVLSPYSDGKKVLTIPLKTRNGNVFGTLTLSLRATPTAVRAPASVFDAKDTDFKWGQFEDSSALTFEAAGVKRTYITDVRAMAEYRQLATARTASNLSTFCAQARALLVNSYSLSLMDRSDLMLNALIELGYSVTASDKSWYTTCFNKAEADMLKSSRNIVVASDGGKVSNLTPDMLYAFGCLSMASAGPKCAERAPKPVEYLLANMAETISFTADSALIPTADIGDGDSFAKQTVLNLIKGRTSGFKCFLDGVLLTAGEDKVFRLRGRVEDGKINSIRIQSVSSSALDCVQ